MKKWLIAGGVIAVVALIVSTQVCISTGFRYGLWLDQCPDGKLQQTISLQSQGVSRGGKAEFTVSTTAHYTTSKSDAHREAQLSSFKPELFLVEAGKETPLAPEKPWKKANRSQRAEFTIPKVNDGDYQLRLKVKSALGESVLDAPLPLYTPARVHVLTDRPLYEPGNTVKFRALALKASTLTPLDERPGTWRVYDPRGEVLLEERAPAGAWGVVSGDFPLDQAAESGTWRVEWASGGTTGSKSFDVRPFTLPRFRVEANAMKPFYRRGERPVVKGSVKYSSGAPVANAKLQIDWSVNGAWPAPTSWLEGEALPKSSTTNAAGAFVLELPAVPEDLQGQSTLQASLSATDPSGDRVEGSVSVLLSEDPIAVSAVTELAGGLVEGFNNRLFLRATTADGRLLEGVTLTVKRLWEARDKGVNAPVDEDGVAALQLDPGPAVNVVIPPQPFRPPPKAKVVTRQSLLDLLDEEADEPALADRLVFDRAEKELSPCAQFVGENGGNVTAGVRVSPGGAVSAVAAPNDRLGRCVSERLSRLKLGPGKDRLFNAQWEFNDEDLPRLAVALDGVPDVPPGLDLAFNQQLLVARDCLPASIASGAFPRRAAWSRKQGAKTVELTWMPSPGAEPMPEAAVRCVEGRLSKIELPGDEVMSQQLGLEDSKEAAVGVAHFDVSAPEKYENVRPQATTVLGYEFQVTARAGDAVLGSTKLLMTPGAIPPLRVRLSSQVLEPGGAVEAEVLRSPDFTGTLPEKLYLTLGRETKEQKLDEQTRKAKFTLPADFEGWAQITGGGATQYLFVQPKAVLRVALTSEKPRYAPGQTAMLRLETSSGDRPGPAAVGLFGVDESLGQLASLPGSDELNSMRPQVSFTSGFPGIDAQALSLGRVRGKNAAAATLLKVSALPSPAELEPAVSVWGTTVFNALEPLTDHFYSALEELHVQARQWESTAGADAKISNKEMATLWSKALDALEARQVPNTDAYGRKLRLHRLPADLLALTEPRTVVVNATRLPEDLENWSQWVAKEKP